MTRGSKTRLLGMALCERTNGMGVGMATMELQESQEATNAEQRWLLIRQRDDSAANLFIYAVKTTGVFCRPGCSSRLPNRKNVIFYDDAGQARAAGFRPCKRCRPDSDESRPELTEAISTACRLIEESVEQPSLNQLASAVGYSPSHLHRLFKQAVGVTPKAYAAMCRSNRVRSQLQSDKSVTEAVYSAGYGTSSRFYEESDAVLGMKPSEYRDGAAGIAICASVATTSLGLLLVAATERGLCALEFGEDETELLQRLRNRFPHAVLQESDEFEDWVTRVVEFVDVPSRGLSLPLDIQGTAFQKRVWEALRNIPAGRTATYSEMARRLGQPRAARAVASACAANKLAVAVPCHRVVRNDGGLGGYRWGLERKKELLWREAEQAGSCKTS